MRHTRIAGSLIVAALGLVLVGGCPSIIEPPADNMNDDGGGGNDDGTGGDNGNDNGEDEVRTVAAALPAKRIGMDLINIHDANSLLYDADCISCHSDRTNEVALDGVTPAAHSTMLFISQGPGNARCVTCHKSGPDFLSYSAGGLREPVNVERDLASESSCTSCHSGGGNLSFYVRPPF